MDDFDIVSTYLRFLEEDKELTMPIAAIESLVTMLRVKQPSTLSELMELVTCNVAKLKSSISNAISLSAGCDLFTRFVKRTTTLYSDWEACRTNLVENGQLFVQRAKELRNKLAEYGVPFIKDDDVILVHSFSRVVYLLLLKAKTEKLVRFRVIVTESRPTGKGYHMAKLLQEAGITVEVIVDNAVGFIIHKVDKILVGAEGVAETGGIINHIGLYQIGCLAQANHKPFYVVTESHKFVRLYPLAPNDLPTAIMSQILTEQSEIANGEDPLLKIQLIDFTPHEYITALITDLGVLTPSAVSEELIKIWYD